MDMEEKQKEYQRQYYQKHREAHNQYNKDLYHRTHKHAGQKIQSRKQLKQRIIELLKDNESLTLPQIYYTLTPYEGRCGISKPRILGFLRTSSETDHDGKGNWIYTPSLIQ